MDRDRDQPRRMPGRGGERDRGENRSDPPPAGKFDPAEWDTPANAVPALSPAASARSDADSAKVVSLLSALETGMQRILASFGMIRDLVADARASSAEADARAAQRAEADKARDEAIQARLIDPRTLEARAEAGARQGASEAVSGATSGLKHQLAASVASNELLGRQIAAERADRLAGDTRRRRRDGWWYGGLAAFALMIPAAYGYGRYGGNETGEANGYARSRDEVAAASWANTPNGKLARQLDQASQLTIPDIAGCPKDRGWHSEKANGRRWCYGFSSSAKMTNGWMLP